MGRRRVGVPDADQAGIDAAVGYLDSPRCAGLSPCMLTAWGRNGS
jgi:hypothetical protein